MTESDSYEGLRLNLPQDELEQMSREELLDVLAMTVNVTNDLLGAMSYIAAEQPNGLQMAKDIIMMGRLVGGTMQVVENGEFRAPPS